MTEIVRFPMDSETIAKIEAHKKWVAGVGGERGGDEVDDQVRQQG